MAAPQSAAPVHVVTVAREVADADLVVVPVFEADDPARMPGLEAPVRDEWSRAAATGELTGKPFEQLILPGGRGQARTALVGVGSREKFDSDAARRFGGAAAMLARQRRAPRLVIQLRLDASHDVPRFVQAAAEGLTLAQHDPGLHKTTPAELGTLTSASIDLPGVQSASHDAVIDAARRGLVLGECTNQVRALVNEPANVLTPRVFASRVEELAAATSLHVSVLDEREIKELNMGLLLGVAQGSVEPPRLIVLEHRPDVAADRPVLGLVGKGITFDTGGISIKPAEGMDRMKMDMGGGAAVVGAVLALSRLNVPVRAIGVVACTENMPGGRAVKPGDVLTGASGKTVEVINTDAEGRLVLGDALWYAQRLGATHLVDVATLTGACVVALGRTTSGLFGRPDDWVETVRTASLRAGERAWPLPVFDDYFEQLKSDIADMTNTGGRPAGAITAALFLKQFAGDGPWAHIDIAGTVWADEPKPWLAKGATGAAVRTLAELGMLCAG